MKDDDVIEGQVTALVVTGPAPAPANWTPSLALSVDEKIAMLREIDLFYRTVLKPGVHYGVIPGTEKPTLYKPGAEALLSAMGLRSETGNEEPPIIDPSGRDHDGEPFIMYDRFCRIYRQTGPTVNDRIEIAKLGGACNSWEPKYRYRNATRKCPSCGKEAIIKGKSEYGGGWVCFKKKDGCGAKFKDGDPGIEEQESGKVANENVMELQNTIKKMADKRALIAATLIATGCSDIFTQDVEDMDYVPAAREPRNVTPAPPPKREPPAHDPDADTEENRASWRKAIAVGARDRKIPDGHRYDISRRFFGQHSTAEEPEGNPERLTARQLHRLYQFLTQYAKDRASDPDHFADEFPMWLDMMFAKYGGQQ